MNPSNIETLILLLLFFLPGYLYFSLKAKFKYQSWENKEIIFLGFLFSSIIFQFFAWLILGIFKVNILSIIRNGNSLNSLLTDNLGLVGLQVAIAMLWAVITAIISSTKQLKRFMLWIQNKTLLNRILELGLEYTPPISGVLGHDTDFGKRFIGCVIQMKNGVFYDGDIKHIAHGENDQDYLIVLRRVTKLSRGIKTKLPDDMKVLIPYDNIESITYKEYPPSKKKNNKGFIVWYPLNMSLALILVLLLLFLALQGQSGNSDMLRLVTELYGAFVVTFLGVYISISYSKKQESEREEKDRENIYLGALKLLASELDLNEQPLKTLSQAIYNVPNEPEKYYDNYGFILEMTRDVKSDVFYSLIASGSMDEVNKSEVIFNKVQQAYYNTSKAINGIGLTREVLKDYEINSRLPTFSQWLAMVSGMIKQEADKVKRAQEMVTSAKEEIVKELNKFGVTFIEGNQETKNPFAEKLKISIVELKKLQEILSIKRPTYPFLNPVFGNVIASMVDLLAYLEGKNPYYTGFDEAFFGNRQAAMHRAFFTDLHVATEEGLREIIDRENFKVVIGRQKKAKNIVERIKKNLKDLKDIGKGLDGVLDLGGSFPTFNDYLNTVLENIPLKKEYKIACRVYFDALNIIRNKVSHSDMTLSEEEKEKLIRGKFQKAISPEGQLQMTFEGYEPLLVDIVRFFDTLNSNIN